MNKLEVCWVAKRGMLFIIFSSVFQFSLSLFCSLCLCRMTRRSNFCWKKPLRHWSMSITYYPVIVSALMLFSLESIKLLTEVWIFIFILFLWKHTSRVCISSFAIFMQYKSGLYCWNSDSFMEKLFSVETVCLLVPSYICRMRLWRKSVEGLFIY